MSDSIIYVNVEGELQEMERVLDMYGSDDLLSENMLRFFVGRAVGYVSESHQSVNILNRVTERVKESIRDYYTDANEIERIETKIINTWINLANTISSLLQEHTHTNGKRNNKLLVLRSFEEQIIGVICTERDEEQERGIFNGNTRGS